MVRGVISSSTRAGSMLCVRGSMSQNTGVICCHWSACAVATNVNGDTITSPVQAGRPDRDLQRDRAVAHGDAVRDARPTRRPPPRTRARAARRWSASAGRSRPPMRSIRRSRSPMFGRPTCTGSRERRRRRRGSRSRSCPGQVAVGRAVGGEPLRRVPFGQPRRRRSDRAIRPQRQASRCSLAQPRLKRARPSSPAPVPAVPPRSTQRTPSSRRWSSATANSAYEALDLVPLRRVGRQVVVGVGGVLEPERHADGLAVPLARAARPGRVSPSWRRKASRENALMPVSPWRSTSPA